MPGLQKLGSQSMVDEFLDFGTEVLPQHVTHEDDSQNEKLSNWMRNQFLVGRSVRKI